METKENLTTPFLNANDQVEKPTSKIDAKDKPVQGKQNIKTAVDKLCHFIKDKNSLLPEGYSSLQDLKKMLNTKKESLKNMIEWEFSGMIGEITCVAMGDTFFLTGDSRGFIKIYQFQSFIQAFSLEHFSSNKISSLVVSNNFQYVVSVQEDTIRCFDISTTLDHSVFSFKENCKVNCVVVSSDNKLILAGLENGSIKIYDIGTQKEAHNFVNTHKDEVLSIAISNDGKYIVSGSADKSMKIFDLDTKLEVHHFENIHQDKVTSVETSSDCKHLVSVSSTIYVHSLETKQELFHIDIEATTTVEDNQSAADPSKSGSSETKILFNKGPVRKVAISKDNQFIIYVSGSVMKAFSLETQKELDFCYEFPGAVSSFGLTNQEGYVIVGSLDGFCKIFKLGEKGMMDLKFPRQQDILTMQFSKDREFFVAGDSGGSTSIFNLNKRRKIYTFRPYDDPVHGVFIFSNKKLVISLAEMSIRFFNLETKEEILKLGKEYGTHSMAVSNNEKFLLAEVESGSLSIFDIEKMQVADTLGNISTNTKISCACFSRDDQNIIVGLRDGSIKLFDTSSKQLVYDFNQAHKNNIVKVIVSNDNRFIISCAADNSIKVFDLEKKLIVRSFENTHTRNISFFSQLIVKAIPFSINVSEDNKYLVSCSEKSIKLWNLETFHELCEYEPHCRGLGVISSALISKDNQYIVAGACEFSVQLFRLESRAEDSSDFGLDLGLKRDIGSFITSYNGELMVVQTGAKMMGINLQTKKEVFCVQIDFTLGRLMSISRNHRYLVYREIFDLKVFDIEMKKEIFSREFEDAHNINLIFSNDNKFMILCSLQSLEVIEIEKQQKFAEISDFHFSKGTVAVTEDSKFLVIGKGKDINVYEFPTCKLVRVFKDIQREFFLEPLSNFIKISNKGNLLLSKGWEHVSILDIETKQRVLVFEDEFAQSMENQPRFVFSENNRYILSKRKGGEKIRMFDMSLKKWIAEFQVSDKEGVNFHISKDNTYIVDGNFKKYPTCFSRMNCVSSKISFDLPQVNYLAALITCVDAEERNRFLIAYNDLYFLPHSWTTLHALAILQPSYISEIPKYEDLKVPFLVDIYGKTPLHYLLAQEGLEYKAINTMLEYILDYIEDWNLSNSYESRKVTDSLSNLFLFIASKSPPRLSHRYLNLCYPQTPCQIDQVLPTFGDARQKYMFSETPVIEPENLSKIHQDGDDRIIFQTNMIKLDFQVESDDMLNTTHVLSAIQDVEMFKLPIVKNLIEHLWKSTEKVMFCAAIFFSLLMILISVYIALNQRLLLMELPIILITMMFVCIEIIEISELKEEYLKELWNWIDLGEFGLIIAFVCIRMTNNQTYLTESWMCLTIIVLGYLRWISYLRLFTPTRHLIETILVVVYDMWGFMCIVVSILIGFSVIFLQFDRGQYEHERPEYFTYFYNTYQLMFGNYDDSQFSVPQTVLTSSLMLVLNVILLNLLISIIGSSFGKVQEKKELIDALSRLKMIQDAIILTRKFSRRKTEKKGYLIHCLPATIEDESEEMLEWKARMDSIKKLFAHNETRLKQVTEKIDKIDTGIRSEIMQVENRMNKKMEQEIGHVRAEIKDLGKLVTDTLTELTKNLKEPSSTS